MKKVIENSQVAGKIIQLKSGGKKVANGEAIYRYSLGNENEINDKIKTVRCSNSRGFTKRKHFVFNRYKVIRKSNRN